MPNLPKLDAPTAYDIAEKSPDEIETLRRCVRVGFQQERGKAWWDSGMPDGTHFDGPVPQSEVDDILGVPISSVPLFAEINGKKVRIPGRQGIVVNGNVVNDRSDSYQIHQFHETLSGFLDELRRDTDIGVGSVGRLRNDALAFIQAVLPETHEVAGFGYQPYVTVATSADSSIATDHFTGGKAGICRNTLDMAAMGALTRVKTKHTLNSLGALRNMRDKLGIQLQQVADQMDGHIDNLVNIEVTEKDFAAWLDEMGPLPELDENRVSDKTGKTLKGPGRAYTMKENYRDELTRLYKKDPMVAPYNGTALGILQTASTYRIYSQTMKQAPAGGRIERNMTADITGLGAKSDKEALDALVRVQERRSLVTV